MTYDIPPGRRMPYDQNGTRVLMSRSVGDDRTPYQLHPRAISALNSDLALGLHISDEWWSFGEGIGEYYAPNYISLMFPHPMDLDGIALSLVSNFWRPDGPFGLSRANVFGNLTARVQVTTNSTNGLDGDWTTIETKDEDDAHLAVHTAFYQVIGGFSSLHQDTVDEPYEPDGNRSRGPNFEGGPGSFYVSYYANTDTRDLKTLDGPLGRGIAPLSVTGVTGLRLLFPRRPIRMDANNYTGGFMNALFYLHLYGQETVADDCLRIVDSSGSSDPDLLWGNVFPEHDYLRSFKVKNTSGSEDAIACSVAITPTFSDPGTKPTALAMSLDGESWAPRLLLGDLAAGETSPEVLLRLNPTTDTVGLRSAHVVAQAGRWT